LGPLLELGVAVDPETGGEPDDRRATGARPTSELGDGTEGDGLGIGEKGIRNSTLCRCQVIPMAGDQLGERLGLRSGAAGHRPILAERPGRFSQDGGVTTTIEVTTSDGTVLHLRLAVADDRAALIAGFEHLGEASRYHRFFTAMPRLSATMLERLTDLDDRLRLAIVAFDPTRPSEIGTDDGLAIGVARYAAGRDDERTAELAVTVVDEYHGRGVGRILLEALVVGGLHRGLVSLYGFVMMDNPGMLRLFRRQGGRDQHVGRPDPGVRRISIDLAAATAAMGPRRDLYGALFADT